MNTLGYISRQYDALASQPTTPITESPPSPAPFGVHLTRSQDDTDILRLGRNTSPKLHRTKSLSRTRPSTAVTLDSVSRAFESNGLQTAQSMPDGLASPANGNASESTPASSTPTPLRLRRRRFILVRIVISLWNGLCTLWSFLPAWKRVRHNFGLLALRSADDTSDEKDDDDEADEIDPLVTRASSTEKPMVSRISFDTQVLTKRTSRSRFGKPPTPVVSPSDLAPVGPEPDDDEPQAGSRTRTPSLSFTPPTPAAATDVPLPTSPTSSNELPTTRPRASSTLLPNPLSTSLLTPSSSSLPSRAPTPPIRRPTALHKTKTLVLDLDETLIHSTSRAMHSHGSMGGGGLLGLSGLFGGGKRQGAGHMVEVVLGGRSTLYHVYKRPFVDFFLRKVSSWYTLVIFTASMPEYADPVIDWLDAGRGMFSRRLFRESCTQLPSGGYSKDLSIIDQDLSRVCLIDNSPISYSINMANGIPIEGWISDPGDEALLDLLPVLDSLRFTSDVRHVLGLRGF